MNALIIIFLVVLTVHVVLYTINLIKRYKKRGGKLLETDKRDMLKMALDIVILLFVLFSVYL